MIAKVKTKVQVQNPGSTNTEVSMKGEEPIGD